MGTMILASAMRHSVGRPAHGNGGRFIAYGAVATRRWLVYPYLPLSMDTPNDMAFCVSP